jgi:aryl-alcohol dehydrogenase-like predicted oxidoreductase
MGLRPQDEGLSAVQIRQQAEASLRRLRTDRIDLYLAHAPDSSVPIEETLKAFDHLIRAGKIRHYGLSNFTGAELAHACEVAASLGLAGPVNLQSAYSLLDRSAADDVFAVCADRGVAFTAYSPLAGGWLSGKYRKPGEYPASSRMTLRPQPYEHWDNELTLQGIQAVRQYAARIGTSLATLAFGWVLSDPAVAAIIVGPRRPEQLEHAMLAVESPMRAVQRNYLVRLVSSPRSD